jgi:hypothetical protein
MCSSRLERRKKREEGSTLDSAEIDLFFRASIRPLFISTVALLKPYSPLSVGNLCVISAGEKEKKEHS